MHFISSFSLNKSLLATSIALSIASPYALAELPTSISISNMKFGTVNYASTGTLNLDGTGAMSSIDPFFFHTWTATQITTFMDNTGSFSGSNALGPWNYNADIAAMTADQIAVGIFFNWNGQNEIPLLEIFDCIPSTTICQGQSVAMQSGPYLGSSIIFSSSTILTCKDYNLTVYGYASEDILLDDLFSGCYFKNGTTTLETFDTISSNGSRILFAGNSLIYTGVAGIEGQDTFSVTVMDDANSFTFNVNILVNTEQNSNFTMQSTTGGTFAGTNDVIIDWDKFSFNNSSDNGSGNNIPVDTNFGYMLISSTHPLLNFNWTAHHIRVFVGPGTFKFDVTCNATDYDNGIVDCNNPLAEQNASQQYITMTLNSDEVGGHILFNWGQINALSECGVASCNIDVINVWKQNERWDTHGDNPPKNALWIGANGLAPDVNTLWGLTSIDGDGDGVNGVQMVDGPFPSDSINFNYFNNIITEGCELFGLVTDVLTGECIEEIEDEIQRKDDNDDESSSALNLTYLFITFLLLLGRKSLNAFHKKKYKFINKAN